jgi:ribosomal protein L10
MDEAGMTSIALIPSRKTLEAQFVNLINSPIQRFVVSLDQIAKKKTS